MTINDSRRLNIVVPYLYPDLENDVKKDYHLGRWKRNTTSLAQRRNNRANSTTTF